MEEWVGLATEGHWPNKQYQLESVFQNLKTFGPYGTCQEIYFSSQEEAQPRSLLVK